MGTPRNASPSERPEVSTAHPTPRTTSRTVQKAAPKVSARTKLAQSATTRTSVPFFHAMLRFLRNSYSRLGVLSRRTFATSNPSLGPVVPSESALGIAAVINRKARVANEFADLRTNTEDRGTWLWCDENIPALEAVKTMTKANVGALLVMRSSVLDVDNDGVVSAEELTHGRWEDAVAGVLTERDYLRKVVAQNKDANATAVGSIMTDKKLYDVAQTDTPVLEA